MPKPLIERLYLCDHCHLRFATEDTVEGHAETTCGTCGRKPRDITEAEVAWIEKRRETREARERAKEEERAKEYDLAQKLAMGRRR